MILKETAEEAILEELRTQLSEGLETDDGQWDYDECQEQTRVNQVLCKVLTSFRLAHPDKVAEVLIEIGEALKKQHLVLHGSGDAPWIPEFEPLLKAAETIRSR